MHAMTKFFFNLSSKTDQIEDHWGVDLDGLYEAHQHAVNLIRRAALSTSGDPWRDWVVDVTDAQGRSVLTVPFFMNVMTRRVFGKASYRDVFSRRDPNAAGGGTEPNDKER
jgi:hypothetical protein